jgi:hypothetical protein
MLLERKMSRILTVSSISKTHDYKSIISAIEQGIDVLDMIEENDIPFEIWDEVLRELWPLSRKRENEIVTKYNLHRDDLENVIVQLLNTDEVIATREMLMSQYALSKKYIVEEILKLNDLAHYVDIYKFAYRVLDIWAPLGSPKIIQALLEHFKGDPYTYHNLMFYSYVKRGNVKGVKRILANPYADPNFDEGEILLAIYRLVDRDVTSNKEDPNHYRKIASEILYLIERIPDVDFGFRDNFLLRDRIEAGDARSVHELLTIYELDPSLNNSIALRIAVRWGNPDVVHEIVSSRKTNVNVHDGDALKIAAKYGFADIARILLDSGAQVDVNNNMPLLVACYYGHVDVVEVLYEYGADIHFNNEQPLLVAVKKGNIDVVKILIELGVDPNNQSAINIAKDEGNYELIKYLSDQNK